jgi:two-component system sensor histidine kinase KdpD
MPSSSKCAPLALAIATSTAVVASETALSWFLLDHRLTDIVMLYVVGVAVVAARYGRLPSMWASVLSVAAFDFFFVPPYFSLGVQDKRFVLTFAVMLFVGIAISNMTARIRRTADAAMDKELRTGRLYSLSRELSVARDVQEIVAASQRALRAAFASEAIVLLSGEDRRLRLADGPDQEDDELRSSVRTRARELLSTGPSDPHTVVFSTGERVLCLEGVSGRQGVLVVRPRSADSFARHSDQELLEAFAAHVALAIERTRLREDAGRAQLDVQRERLRNALLSSVSRDLRSPLAALRTAVRTLLDEGPSLTMDRFHACVGAISDDATRLDRLVRNLLDMTSLEAGALPVRKEWQPLEEVVGVALGRLEEQLANRSVVVDIAADASLVPFDAVLLERVFVNLVENAVRHAPDAARVEIRARRAEHDVAVEVVDDGPGVPAGQEEAVFGKFFRSDGADGADGMGLGLTVCRGIVAAHGGRIWCEASPKGGSFHFTLPLDGGAPTMKPLPDE